jgi:hypothetical protein
MSLGYELYKAIIDTKAAQAALDLRNAFYKVQIMAEWLGDNPVPEGGTDPLISKYNYTADEAYALRLYFETFDNVRVSNQSGFAIGRKITGLE